MAEVLGDEARVSELLPRPGRGRVAERVRGDVLFESDPFRRTADSLGEDRLLEASAVEAAEDGRLGARLPRRSEDEQIVREFRWQRLPPGLAAFASPDDPLIERFFTQAPTELRGHAIQFMGLSLGNAATVDEEGAARFRALWDKRLAAFKAGETGVEELKGFAWSFSSGKLDDDWSLAQLRGLLERGAASTPTTPSSSAWPRSRRRASRTSSRACAC